MGELWVAALVAASTCRCSLRTAGNILARQPVVETFEHLDSFMWPVVGLRLFGGHTPRVTRVKVFAAFDRTPS